MFCVRQIFNGILIYTIPDFAFGLGVFLITKPLTMQGTAYSQYEVAIPVSRISRCFKGLFEMVYNSGVDDRAR